MCELTLTTSLQFQTLENVLRGGAHASAAHSFCDDEGHPKKGTMPHEMMQVAMVRPITSPYRKLRRIMSELSQPHKVWSRSPIGGHQTSRSYWQRRKIDFDRISHEHKHSRIGNPLFSMQRLPRKVFVRGIVMKRLAYKASDEWVSEMDGSLQLCTSASTLPHRRSMRAGDCRELLSPFLSFCPTVSTFHTDLNKARNKI